MKKEKHQWGFIFCALRRPLHTTPQLFDVLSRVHGTDGWMDGWMNGWMDGQRGRLTCINNFCKKSVWWTQREMISELRTWPRAAEQRKVFSLLGLSLNDASCHRLILIQQKCKGAVFFRPSSRLQLHPLSHSWPQGAFGRAPTTYVSTHTSVRERIRLCGVFCIVVSQSEVMRARLSSRERRE